MRDFAFAIDRYCDEIRVEPAEEIINIRRFAQDILRTDYEYDYRLENAMYEMVSDSDMLNLLKEGLVLGTPGNPITGRFFGTPYVFKTTGLDISTIYPMLNAEASGKHIEPRRRAELTCYLIVTFAKAIETFISVLFSGHMKPHVGSDLAIARSTGNVKCLGSNYKQYVSARSVVVRRILVDSWIMNIGHLRKPYGEPPVVASRMTIARASEPDKPSTSSCVCQ